MIWQDTQRQPKVMQRLLSISSDYWRQYLSPADNLEVPVSPTPSVQSSPGALNSPATPELRPGVCGGGGGGMCMGVRGWWLLRGRGLLYILYRLLLSECVVAMCFLFLFSSRESIPWFLSVPQRKDQTTSHVQVPVCVHCQLPLGSFGGVETHL